MLIVKWLTSKFLYLLKPYLIYQHPEIYRLVRSASMLATRTQFLQISELGYRIWFPSVWCGKYGGREIGWFWGAIVVYRETEIPICWVSFYGKSLDGSRSSNMCDFIVIDTLGLISKLLDVLDPLCHQKKKNQLFPMCLCTIFYLTQFLNLSKTPRVLTFSLDIRRLKVERHQKVRLIV